jgi:hypothetical protein
VATRGRARDCRVTGIEQLIALFGSIEVRPIIEKGVGGSSGRPPHRGFDFLWFFKTMTLGVAD